MSAKVRIMRDRTFNCTPCTICGKTIKVLQEYIVDEASDTMRHADRRKCGELRSSDGDEQNNQTV